MKRVTILLLLFLEMAALPACKSSQLQAPLVAKPVKFKIAILYPNGEGKTFDMNYYQQKHMPMVAGLLGKNLRFYEIDKGISGRTPSDKPPFLAIGYFYVDDIAEYGKVIAENRDKVVGDFKNYTNVQPVVQISEVKQVVNTGNN